MSAMWSLAIMLSCNLRTVAFAPEQGYIAIVATRYATTIRKKLKTSWNVVELENATTAELSAARAVIPNIMSLKGDKDAISKLLARVPNGKLLQWPLTGVDSLNLSDVPPRFVVCDVHQGGVSISEYVLASLLSWNIQLPEQDAALRQCTWHHGQNSCVFPPRHRAAKGQTIGIIGYGTIGVEVAARAAAFGMRPIAVTKSVPHETPAPLAWIAGDDKLPQLMAESDFVVLAVPLNTATKGMINHQSLSYMKRTGVLINIARGPVVDEAALYAALESRTIGGAILDVWWNDFTFMLPGSTVWPASNNFSSLPNVRMTPHSSSNTDEATDEQAAQCASNLDALANGNTFHNVVRNASQPTTSSGGIESINIGGVGVFAV